MIRQFAHDCERIYQCFHPEVRSLLAGLFNAGCECSYCAKCKRAGAVASLIEHAVRLQALYMGAMEDSDFKPLLDLVEANIRRVREERDGLAKMQMSGNAPSSDMPQ